MSQQSWKPVRLASSQAGGKSEKSSGSILVDLVVFNENIKKELREIIETNPEFRIKDLNDPEVPRVVILELDEDPAESFSFIETIVQAVDGREVFLTSPRTDSNVLLEALRAGAKEFFPQPLQRDHIEVALQKCVTRYEQTSQSKPKKLGNIISVVGGKGGVGTTSVAANLALSLQAATSPRSVVLAEINQQGGDLALFLDLQTTNSLRDLGSDLSRLDTALLTRVLSKHSSGVHVLPSGYDDLSSGRLSPDFVEPVLKLLQSLFDFVVVDCGHVLDLTTKKAIEQAANIVVVSTLIVPVVHRTKRILDLLRASGTNNEKIRIIFNRYSPDEREVLKETEEALKFKTSWVIPNDYPASSGAINSGIPLILSNPKSPISRTFADIVKALGHGGQEKKESENWVGRLRGIMVGRTNTRQAKAS